MMIIFVNYSTRALFCPCVHDALSDLYWWSSHSLIVFKFQKPFKREYGPQMDHDHSWCGWFIRELRFSFCFCLMYEQFSFAARVCSCHVDLFSFMFAYLFPCSGLFSCVLASFFFFRFSCSCLFFHVFGMFFVRLESFDVFVFTYFRVLISLRVFGCGFHVFGLFPCFFSSPFMSFFLYSCFGCTFFHLIRFLFLYFISSSCFSWSFHV